MMVNLRKVGGVIPANGVYIGRNSCHGETHWGNHERKPVPQEYEEWLKTAEHVLTRIDELRGRDLYCHCYPRKCHGEILAEVAAMTHNQREHWKISQDVSCLDVDFPDKPIIVGNKSPDDEINPCHDDE